METGRWGSRKRRRRRKRVARRGLGGFTGAAATWPTGPMVLGGLARQDLCVASCRIFQASLGSHQFNRCSLRCACSVPAPVLAVKLR